MRNVFRRICYSSAEERIRLYNKILYNLARFLHYVPIKYEFHPHSPDVIVLIRESKCEKVLFRIFPFFLNCLQIVNVAIWFFIGQYTLFEVLFVLGMCLPLTGMTSCQFFMLLPTTKDQGQRLINTILQEYHLTLRIKPPRSYEFVCLWFAITGVSFLYLPGLVMVEWYLPSLFHLFHLILDAVTVTICFGNERLAYNLAFILQFALYTLVATALGHALFNATIILQWIITYFHTTNALLENLILPVAENVKRTTESEYMRLRLSFAVFNHILNTLLSVIYFHLIIIIIIFTYITLLSKQLPLLIAGLVFLAAAFMYLALYSILSPATNSHLLSYILIETGRKRVHGKCERQLKFWRGMRPVRFEFGGVCSCETKEMLLVLWFDVILRSTVDLLLTFPT